MVTISDTAVEKAKEILSAEGKADWGLRFYTAGSSCCSSSYGLDIDEHPAEGDKIIEKNGLRVFIDKNTFDKLNGMGIDFVDDGAKKGFMLTGKQPPSSGSGCDTCE